MNERDSSLRLRMTVGVRRSSPTIHPGTRSLSWLDFQHRCSCRSSPTYEPGTGGTWARLSRTAV